MRKYATDELTCDLARIISENDRFIKIRAAITAVGVYNYPDGRAFKSRRALLAATFTARYAKLTVGDHPPTMIIMNQAEICGGLEKPYFERDRIWAVLNFDKRRTPQPYVNALHDADLKADVSIGFYYSHVPEKGQFNGRDYDYRMEDIVIDHVAAFVLKGRCSYPTCGIGVDTAFQQIIHFRLDKVVRRGDYWCVVHCHPDGTPGDSIKCYSIKEFGNEGAKAKAEKMHRAIQARQHAGSHSDQKLNYEKDMQKYFKGVDQESRPPKDWWDRCTSKAQSFATDPAKFCGWLWHNATGHWTKIRESFGKASLGGKGMSENEEAEFEKCVSERLEAFPEMTREEAEVLCKPATKPQDEPTPPGGTLGDAELSPYQKCIKEKVDSGLDIDKATTKCKEEGVAKTDEDATFENCVDRKMAEGKSREEAEKECRAEHPVAEEDQEAEPTPLEKCIDAKMEEGMTAEEAKEWCEAELGGEHESADALIENSQNLISMKRLRDKTGKSY